MLVGSETRALVTGASRGIGRALARALAARGARVGLVGRNPDDLATLAKELGEGHVTLPADVSKRTEIEGAVKTFANEAGGLDLVIANAGIAHYAPFADQDPKDAEQMVNVNVLGSINTVRAGLPPPLLDQARGHIVVVSSGAALRAFPWAAVYGATKAANKGFAEALRHELSGTGVSLTTVFPGEVETDLHSHERDVLPDWRKNEGEIPPEEVAEAVLAAVTANRREVHVPREVKLLALNDLAPKLTDRLLALVRGGAAARTETDARR